MVFTWRLRGHVGAQNNREKVFWEFDSIIMQNTSHNLLLFCPPTWPSHHVTENHLYLILGYLYPMTDTNVTDNFNTYVNHLANKHVGHVKPFYATPFDDLTFDVWTRETVFREVGGVVGDLGIWQGAYKLSTSLLQPFFAHLVHYFTLTLFFWFVCADRQPSTGQGIIHLLTLT